MWIKNSAKENEYNKLENSQPQIDGGHNNRTRFLWWLINKLNDNFSPMCNLCQQEIETSFHIYNGCLETALYKVDENASPGAILRYFTEKFYLRELYKKYSQLNPGREGQGPPDNG